MTVGGVGVLAGYLDVDFAGESDDAEPVESDHGPPERECSVAVGDLATTGRVPDADPLAAHDGEWRYELDDRVWRPPVVAGTAIVDGWLHVAAGDEPASGSGAPSDRRTRYRTAVSPPGGRTREPSPRVQSPPARPTPR